MTTSLDTVIRRSLGTIVAVTVVACVGVGSAAADGRPAASYYTKQQLQVMAERGAAKAAHDSLLVPVANPAASYYTKQQLRAMSQSWAARGALGAVSNVQAALASLSPQTRDALVARLGKTPVVAGSQSSFGWSDFGIGAAGMLGLVLLGGGAFLAVRFARRSGRVPAQRPV